MSGCELELLEQRTLVPPCEETRLQLLAHGCGRVLPLSGLKARAKGHCVWCGRLLDGRKIRWCSEDCVRTAQFHCYPQEPAAKMYRLIYLQDFSCARCGECFDDEIRARIRKLYEATNRVGAYGFRGPEKKWSVRTAEDPPTLVTLQRLGDNTGDRWQTDHIVPVHRGGKGIAPENLQVLCVDCHRDKTKEER